MVVNLIKPIRSTTNGPHIIQLLVLWSSHSWSTFTKSKADLLPNHQLLVGRVLVCNVTKFPKEAVADAAWLQSTITTRYGIF